MVAVYDRAPIGPQPPDTVAALRQSAGLLRAFVETLPEAQQDVFVRSRLSGMTGVEVSGALGINANTMWSRLRAADRALQRFVREQRRQLDPTLDARHPDARDSRARRILALVGLKLPLGAKVIAAVGLAAVVALCLRSPAEAASPAIPEPIPPPVVRTSVAIIEDGRGPVADALTVPPRSVFREEAARVAGPRSQSQRSSPWAARSQTQSARRRPTRSDAEAESEAEAEARPEAGAGPEAEPESESEATGLAAEARALRAVRVALRQRSAARALRLLHHYRLTFGEGALATDARALRIRSLCALGRDAKARELARAAGLPALVAVGTHGCAALRR